MKCVQEILEMCGKDGKARGKELDRFRNKYCIEFTKQYKDGYKTKLYCCTDEDAIKIVELEKKRIEDWKSKMYTSKSDNNMKRSSHKADADNRRAGYYMRISNICWINSQQG
jgi:hypothetical protein